MKKILVSVSGGLGKQVMFTSLTKKLAEVYDEIHVTSPYPDIMLACKHITHAYNFGQADLTPLIDDPDCDIVSGNPYEVQGFIKRKIHVLDAWSQLLGIEFTSIEDYAPIIDTSRLSPDIKIETDKIKNELGEKYIVIQFNGGQSPITNGIGEYVEVLHRNYRRANELVKLIQGKYPGRRILNYSLPNEPNVDGSIKLQAPYVFYFNLLEGAEAVYCIDSSLQHMATAVNKPCTVIWGETKPQHFGWDLHKNLVVDENAGSPYFVALGPSNQNIEFHTPDKII